MLLEMAADAFGDRLALGRRSGGGLTFAELKERAGAGVPSAYRITLLRDADGDGVAEQRHVFLEGLHSPFGMALVGDTLYVDSLSEPDGPVPTYLDLLRHDAELIAAGLRGEGG